jgi:Tol biopolymer transport system component
MRRFIIIASAVLFCCFIAAGAASARGIYFAVLRTVVNVSQPQISPDGKQIAFMKSTSDYVKNKHVSQLMLLDVASGATRALTYDRTGLDSPRWSPTGDRLAFIADAGSGDDTQSQIFVLPMNGGDPLQATKAKNGVDEFTWKPDG